MYEKFAALAFTLFTTIYARHECIISEIAGTYYLDYPDHNNDTGIYELKTLQQTPQPEWDRHYLS